MSIQWIKLATLGLLLSTFSSHTIAQEGSELPKKWEFGLGVGAVSGPDYLGSKESHSYISPIPYVVYRGKIFQSDNDGIRGRFINTERLDFTLSLSANITPEAHKNDLRKSLGLDELGSTVELGPALTFTLTGNKHRGLSLALPVRSVFAIGGDEDGYIGYLVQPQLIYRTHYQQYGITYRASVTYADQKYHDYYYRIDPEFATPDYSHFRPKAGYSGFSNQFAVGRMFGDWRAAIFVRYDYLGGTRFEDSPLVETKSAVRGGLALIWVMK